MLTVFHLEEKTRFRGGALPVFFLIISILLSAAVSGCGSAAVEPDVPGTRLQVVTTIFPQYDFARRIAGDAADVYMLLKPGEEVHSYEPTPQDIRLIQGSDLFIYTGGENDVWIDNILESIAADAAAAESDRVSVRVNRPRPHAVRFLDLVNTYEEEQLEGMMPEKGGHDHPEDPEGHEVHDDPEDPEGHEDRDHHEEPDEHVWTSPANCAILIEKMTEEFCALDPENAAQYRANGDAYRAEFEALDAEYREMVLAARRKTIIFGDRFPFRYLAEAYGLTCYAAFSGCSAESEPSAATIAFLIEKAAEEAVPVVFTIEFSNGNIARAVSEAAQARLKKKWKEAKTVTEKGKTAEAGYPEASEVAEATVESGGEQTAQIRVLRLHSCHNLTRDEFAAGETCLSLMRQNLEMLRAALN